MRWVEFALETDADGRMNFRANRLFGGPAMWETTTTSHQRRLNRLPAVDGQLGAIVRLYREWKFSGDDSFLIPLWPQAVRALEFAFEHWDEDRDFVLEGEQHNTYDIEFHGPNSLSNSMFYAALRAAAELADHLGETERAARYRQAAEEGAEEMDRLLWNGDYYIQLLENPDSFQYQYGTGCLSDQVFGQLCAHIVGLGYVLPASHVRKAIESVFRYNFRPNLSGHHHGQRTFALDDEGGLLLCTWPLGGRPREPLIYSDEVWSGIEYQVAAHLIYEGLVEEGLTIVRTARARYDGYRRNPWNEVEAGNHYVRSMASWALVLALGGYSYDAPKATIGFAPATTMGEFRSFFSTGNWLGVFCPGPLRSALGTGVRITACRPHHVATAY